MKLLYTDKQSNICYTEIFRLIIWIKQENTLLQRELLLMK